MNGPWFTVQKIGEWNTLGTARISNGSETVNATIKLKLELSDAEGSKTALRPGKDTSSKDSSSISTETSR